MSDASPPETSIVIRSFNEERWLPEVLKSIERQKQRQESPNNPSRHKERRLGCQDAESDMAQFPSIAKAKSPHHGEPRPQKVADQDPRG